MQVVAADSTHTSAWLALRRALWPECPEPQGRREINDILNSPRQTAFLALNDDGQVIGFIEMSLREYVDGCSTSPVGYVEGIYVVPIWRQRGIARQLLATGETWTRDQDCTELGSDAALENEVSLVFHKILGFRETARQIVLLKRLD